MNEDEFHEILKEKPPLASGRWGYVMPSFGQENAVHFSIKFAEPGMVCFRTGQTSADILPDNPWLDITELYRRKAKERLDRAREVIQDAEDQGRRFAPIQQFEVPYLDKKIGKVVKVTAASVSHTLASTEVQLTSVPDDFVWAILPKAVRKKCEWAGISVSGDWGIMGHLTLHEGEELSPNETEDLVATFRDLTPPELCIRIIDHMINQEDLTSRIDRANIIKRAWQKAAPGEELIAHYEEVLTKGMIASLEDIRDRIDEKETAIKSDRSILSFDAIAFRVIERLSRLDKCSEDAIGLARKGRSNGRDRWTAWKDQPGLGGTPRMLWPELFRNFFPRRGVMLPIAQVIAELYATQIIRSYKTPSIRQDVFQSAQKALFYPERELVQKGNIALILTSKNVTGEVAQISDAPMIPDYIMRGEGLSSTQTKAGQLLLRWIGSRAHIQRAMGNMDYRRIVIEGGDTALAKELGLSRSKIKDVKQCIEWFTYLRPYVENVGGGSGTHHIGLITSSLTRSNMRGKGRQVRRTIIVGEALLPGYEQQGRKGTIQRSLVPIPPLPPELQGNHQGRVLALQNNLWVELRDRASELAQHGGIILTFDDWASLAEPVGMNEQSLRRTMDIWSSADKPMITTVDKDRYTLTDHYSSDLDMIMRAGKQSLAGRRGGRKAAKKNRKYTK